MTETDLIKCFKHRLRPRKNTEYLQYRRSKANGKDVHHVLGSFLKLKLNDLLLVTRRREDHDHSQAKSEEEKIEDVLESLENLFDYVEFLQKNGGK